MGGGEDGWKVVVVGGGCLSASGGRKDCRPRSMNGAKQIKLVSKAKQIGE